MTGPEHYLEAEKLLAAADYCEHGSAGERSRLAYAQVHATLAQTAAIAIAFTSDEPVAEEADAWKAVVGVASVPAP